MNWDAVGAAAELAGAAAVTGVSVAGLSRVDGGGALVILFVAIGLMGWAAPGTLMTSVPVLKWFVRDRGRAIAMTSIGIPVASATRSTTLNIAITAAVSTMPTGPISASSAARVSRISSASSCITASVKATSRRPCRTPPSSSATRFTFSSSTASPRTMLLILSSAAWAVVQ